MKRSDSDHHPTFELEATTLKLGRGPVAGVDEAGRGPWAGPVVAAAVILDPNNIPAGIHDSKILTEDQREVVFARIMNSAHVGVGISDPECIDQLNILNATLLAMRQAVLALSQPVKLALIDGNKTPLLDCERRAIVGGDAKCLSIAAASIVAKVTRDRLMVEFAKAYPGYGFERHKGYGTPEHKHAMASLGPCAIHRRSFKPVQLVLGLSSMHAGAAATSR